MRAFCFDDNGYLTGETVADQSPLEPGIFHFPARSVPHEPPAVPQGKRARWNGAVWQLEDLPPPPPEPVPQTAADIRRGEIMNRLTAIDAESVRALREAVKETGRGRPAPAFSLNKLEALETEATDLRAELAALPA